MPRVENDTVQQDAHPSPSLSALPPREQMDPLSSEHVNPKASPQTIPKQSNVTKESKTLSRGSRSPSPVAVRKSSRKRNPVVHFTSARKVPLRKHPNTLSFSARKPARSGKNPLFPLESEREPLSVEPSELGGIENRPKSSKGGKTDFDDGCSLASSDDATSENGGRVRVRASDSKDTASASAGSVASPLPTTPGRYRLRSQSKKVRFFAR